MNDRFKFRVWYDGRYIYKDLCDSNYYTEDGKCVGLANTLPNDLPWEQCIGLKDKNGNLIYEGDIVKQFNNHGRLLREGWIVYDEREMKFKIREERCPDWNEKTDDFTFHPLKQRLLVIGNIHENKELLYD